MTFLNAEKHSKIFIDHVLQQSFLYAWFFQQKFVAETKALTEQNHFLQVFFKKMRGLLIILVKDKDDFGELNKVNMKISFSI